VLKKNIAVTKCTTAQNRMLDNKQMLR